MVEGGSEKFVMVCVDRGGWFEECVARKVGDGVDIYLSFYIGCDPRRLLFQESVLNHIKNRLSGGKSHFLSFFCGRLILLKFVLTSLPVY